LFAVAVGIPDALYKVKRVSGKRQIIHSMQQSTYHFVDPRLS
jgi:hypothetical protein